MKKILLSFFSLFFLFPVTSYAQENSFDIVAMEEKYYKTVTRIENSDYSMLSSKDSNYSYSIEISKEEYDSYKPTMIELNATTTVETTYKKLTTYLLNGGSYFRYKAVLEWKSFPKVRSYDTIAIGHYASVRPLLEVQFEQTYCLTDGTCRTIQGYYPQTFASGSSATFKVPTGDLTKLTQTIYFDVEKVNNNTTVVAQVAAGDYSHAIKTVSVDTAKSFVVSTSGITYNANVRSSFDEIQAAKATWSGSW